MIDDAERSIRANELLSEDDATLLALMRKLPVRDLRAQAAERVRLRAKAALAQSAHETAGSTAWTEHTYRRAEPVFISAVAACYLFLALQAVLPP